MTTLLSEIREATRAREAAKQAAQAADAAWRDKIKDATAAGERVFLIAKAAGDITTSRVYQIRDGVRTGSR
ncbi:hypothetical protein [Nocardia seriolae]|uniref:Uncharacterized protein n=1 Tax=Nocardia seriolae TaxID=37332 RepID=A0A0B8NDB3_9NOCA|nr:hypothetical protein [Nocardia seriolae]APA97005.1 hypothetical protein NS506_02946 [Nocardia seriolae]MTJ65187.1 hypothetical protein [Nocardia seriolae]MTJ75328.1 hypothetical protein [Nocardia seriolae]MTJ86891.1 hypothetical protein [Nocardia seriolae]MTK30886.1 hypothetical protein [Nocardia seriolae]